MNRPERFYVAMPESHPTANEGKRVAPNEGHFPVDATTYVFTDDGHLMTFGIARKGPAEKDFLLTLVDAKPPLTERPPYEKEVYVEGDRIIEGREFRLAAALPVLSQTAFRAVTIFSNIEQMVIPIDQWRDEAN